MLLVFGTKKQNNMQKLQFYTRPFRKAKYGSWVFDAKIILFSCLKKT
jgi:hypothetical protein